MRHRRLSHDARRSLADAAQEATRRGATHIGTEHLLLALLSSTDARCASAVGAEAGRARDTLHEMDVRALRSIGVSLDRESPTSRSPRRRRGPRRLSAGARAALTRTVEHARSTQGPIEPPHLLLGLLDAGANDPAVALLDALGRDPADIRNALSSPSQG